jgi:hypothetical protein
MGHQDSGPDVPIIAVRGEVFREVEPEIARFSVTVQAAARDRQEALGLLTERVRSLRELMDGYPGAIEARETTGLHVYPDRKQSTDKVRGYRGAVTTTVTVTDFAVLGELMLRLSNQDQTAVSGPWWELRRGSPVHREARTAAIGDAIERARDYAAALGAQVLRLVELADAGLGNRTSEFRGVAFASTAPGGAPGGAPQLDLEPQRQQIQAQIEARFLISEPTVLGAEPAR